MTAVFIPFAAIAETIVPNIEGIPCKICTPHVSLKLIFYFKKGPINKKPIADKIPAKKPTKIA